MLSKNLIKDIKLLHQSKQRKLQNRFIVEGPKVVNEFLESDLELDFIVHTEAFQMIKNVNSHLCSEEELKKISLQKNPKQVLAIFKNKDKQETLNYSKGLYLALDAIRDPGNLGTIIRTADWFGIKHILCSEDTVEQYNPKVIQSAMGASTRIQLHYINLEELLLKNKEIQAYSALMEGNNLYHTSLPEDAIIFIGNEANGLSQNLQDKIANNVHIPRAEGSITESLNASIATALILAEFRRSTGKI